jgi:hypothetical protein
MTVSREDLAREVWNAHDGLPRIFDELKNVKDLPPTTARTIAVCFAAADRILAALRAASSGTVYEECARWHEDRSRLAMNSLHCGDNATTIQMTRIRAEWHDNCAKELRMLRRPAPEQAAQGDVAETAADRGGAA